MQAAGSEAQKKALLPGMASGQTTLTLAVLEENARWDEAGINLSAEKNGSGYVLNGVKLFVPDAHVVDHIICAARTVRRGDAVCARPPTGPGLGARLLKTMDQTRKLCAVTLDNVQAGADALLGAPGQGWGCFCLVSSIRAKSP